MERTDRIDELATAKERKAKEKVFMFRAEFDDSSVNVYQAFNGKIADYTTQNQELGGEGFTFNRRTWIKPSFYWMMNRSNWGRKENQDRILKIQLSRDFFDELLEKGVPSQPLKNIYEPYGLWDRRFDNETQRSRLARESDVIYQLDPERNNRGFRTGTRAVQIGIKGDMLKRYALSEIVGIKDITPQVRKESERLMNGDYTNGGGSAERNYPAIIEDA